MQIAHTISSYVNEISIKCGANLFTGQIGFTLVVLDEITNRLFKKNHRTYFACISAHPFQRHLSTFFSYYINEMINCISDMHEGCALAGAKYNICYDYADDIGN